MASKTAPLINSASQTIKLSEAAVTMTTSASVISLSPLILLTDKTEKKTSQTETMLSSTLDHTYQVWHCSHHES